MRENSTRTVSRRRFGAIIGGAGTLSGTGARDTIAQLTETEPPQNAATDGDDDEVSPSLQLMLVAVVAGVLSPIVLGLLLWRGANETNADELDDSRR
ncbi:hypothetical protein [Halocatena halophila]|uniref:hypothetical protein n=1 Tax=Halocatena halophila TaxID=2814576 RepID=UPI002ECFD614